MSGRGSRLLQQSHIVQISALCMLVDDLCGVRPPYGIVVVAGGVQERNRVHGVDRMGRAADDGRDAPRPREWRAESAHQRITEGGRSITVTAVRKDPRSRTMTLEAEFDASPERVWQLWADPRQLERWWGPPTYSATVEAHDLRPGGRVEYHMTGPRVMNTAGSGKWSQIDAILAADPVAARGGRR